MDVGKSNFKCHFVYLEPELVLDVDDLYGIIDQILAISLGYAEPFKAFDSVYQAELLLSTDKN